MEKLKDRINHPQPPLPSSSFGVSPRLTSHKGFRPPSPDPALRISGADSIRPGAQPRCGLRRGPGHENF